MSHAPESKEVEGWLTRELQPDERLLGVLPGLGASLGLTTTRVVIVRVGRSFRPRSGVRSWDLAAIRQVSASEPKHGQGRIALRVGDLPWQVVSIFFEAERWAGAQRLVREIRTRSLPGSNPPAGGD